MDNLVKPDDSLVFMHVSCILQLQDTPLACLTDPEDIQVDDEHDATQSQLQKLKRVTARNRELRQSSMN